MKILKKIFSIHFLIALILTLIPILLWGNQYFLAGGDDSRLYYQFPRQIIDNYAQNISGNNSAGSLGGYGTQAFQIPFLYLVLIAKTLLPFVNTQLLFCGLNIAIGYYSIILLLRCISRKKFTITNEVIVGLVYVFSNFTFFTLWNHQLFSLYLVSIFPLALHLFVESVTKNKVSLVVLDAILVSIFSVVIISVPWLVGTVICVSPIILYLLFEFRLRFAKYAFIFLALLVLLNSYWLFHFLYSTFSSYGSDIINTSFSQFRVTDANNTIRSSVYGNTLVKPLFFSFHNQNTNLILLSPLILVVFLAPFLDKKLPKQYFILFLCWITALYLFTVNIFGDSGLRTFLWFNNHIPGFNMFRYMFDKFSHGMALVSSLILGFSFSYVYSLPKKLYLFILVSTLLACGYLSVNFLNYRFGSSIIPSSNGYFYSIKALNKDYINLTKFIKDMDDESEFAWFPLNIANYTPIRDEYESKRYYFGISPLTFFSNKNDIAGIPGFGKFSSQIETAIKDGNTSDLLNIFKDLNINYIILNKDIDKGVAESYIYPLGLYYKQINDNFLIKVLGKEVKNFGNKYIIYEINPLYKSNKISITKSKTQLEEKVDFNYLSKSTIELNINNIESLDTINFQEPNSKNWGIMSQNKTHITLAKTKTDHYGNYWLIEDNICDITTCYENNGLKSIKLFIYFKPDFYDKIVKLISITTFVGCLAYLFLKFALHGH